jgi:hypothetical protein
MATGKRASMREGPLAQLFRKTEDETRPKPDSPKEEEQPTEEPRAGRPLPEGGPSPQATRRLPEPQGQAEPPHGFERRATEAARRAEDREERRREREQRWSRYEGLPTPE